MNADVEIDHSRINRKGAANRPHGTLFRDSKPKKNDEYFINPEWASEGVSQNFAKMANSQKTKAALTRGRAHGHREKTK